jgi:hypothetical protein
MQFLIFALPVSSVCCYFRIQCRQGLAVSLWDPAPEDGVYRQKCK